MDNGAVFALRAVIVLARIPIGGYKIANFRLYDSAIIRSDQKLRIGHFHSRRNAARRGMNWTRCHALRHCLVFVAKYHRREIFMYGVDGAVAAQKRNTGRAMWLLDQFDTTSWASPACSRYR